MSGMRMISDGIAMAEKQASCAYSAHPCPSLAWLSHSPGRHAGLVHVARQAEGALHAAERALRAKLKNNAQGADINECRTKVTVSESWSSLAQPPTFEQRTRRSRPVRARFLSLPPSPCCVY